MILFCDINQPLLLTIYTNHHKPSFLQRMNCWWEVERTFHVVLWWHTFFIHKTKKATPSRALTFRLFEIFTLDFSICSRHTEQRRLVLYLLPKYWTWFVISKQRSRVVLHRSIITWFCTKKIWSCDRFRENISWFCKKIVIFGRNVFKRVCLLNCFSIIRKRYKFFCWLNWFFSGNNISKW